MFNLVVNIFGYLKDSISSYDLLGIYRSSNTLQNGMNYRIYQRNLFKGFYDEHQHTDCVAQAHDL